MSPVRIGCFNPDDPGKIQVYDGRTGEPFDRAVTVGKAYMLKLVPPGRRQDPRPVYRPLLPW